MRNDRPHLKFERVAVGLFAGQDHYSWCCRSRDFTGFGTTKMNAYREWQIAKNCSQWIARGRGG